MDIFQIIFLGLVQAITEWLPLSSKTMDTIAYTGLFGGANENVVSVLLFLHLGTLLAAIIYFRKEIAEISRELVRTPDIRHHARTKTGYLATALFFTGLVGIPLLLVEHYLLPSLKTNMLLSIMGAGLILTGFLLTTQHKHRWRIANSASWQDGILTGALQGLSVLPGVSRAGCTTTGLIWRGFDAESSFHLSFLLAIPTVFLAEVLLWAAQMGVSSIPLEEGILLAASSFVFGYVTIGALLSLAHRINVASLAFLFGMLMLAFGIMGIG
ncbi:MAG: undecaprenyl-diphosphate phosphatase [Candidatus Micrarchaeia archaeon]|jgi:undecaprenyl-diphosphatase